MEYEYHNHMKTQYTVHWTENMWSSYELCAYHISSLRKIVFVCVVSFETFQFSSYDKLIFANRLLETAMLI